MLALWLQSSKSFRDMLGIHCRKAVPLSSVPLRMCSEISRYFNTVYYTGFIQCNILLQVRVTANVWTKTLPISCLSTMQLERACLQRKRFNFNEMTGFVLFLLDLNLRYLQSSFTIKKKNSLHLSSLPFSVVFISVPASELGYSSEALPMQLHSSRTIPTKPPSEDALIQVNSIPGSGLVILSTQMPRTIWKFSFMSATSIGRFCWQRNDGGLIFFTSLIVKMDLAYKLIMLFCSHYYKPVTSSMSLSVSCGEYIKNCSTPQRS